MAMENLLSSDGTIAQAEPGEFRVIKGVGYRYFKNTAVAIAANSWLSGVSPIVIEAATTTTVTALGTAGGIAAVVQFAVGASEYFWAAVGPFYLSWDDSTSILGLVNTATTGNQLYSYTSAGVISDSTSGSAIKLNGVTIVAIAAAPAAVAFYAYDIMKWKS